MERLAIPLLMPVAITALVVLIIAGIGSLLLWLTEISGEALATAVALAMAGAVLLGCMLAARAGRREPAHRR